MRDFTKYLFLFSVLFASIVGSLFASGRSEPVESEEPTVIQFWYAFSDAPRSGWIQDRIAEWNEMNPEFQVVGERKGSYRETLQAAVLAARQGEPPHLTQLFEVGSQLAVDSGIFLPVGEVGGIPARVRRSSTTTTDAPRVRTRCF